MSKDGVRINANEFDEKARDARPQQIFGRDFAERPRTAQCLCAEPPQIPEQHNAKEEFVDGRGVNAAVEWLSVVAADLRAGNQAVKEAHAPRDVRRYAVIAVPGNQTADPA